MFLRRSTARDGERPTSCPDHKGVCGSKAHIPIFCGDSARPIRVISRRTFSLEFLSPSRHRGTVNDSNLYKFAGPSLIRPQDKRWGRYPDVVVFVFPTSVILQHLALLKIGIMTTTLRWGIISTGRIAGCFIRVSIACSRGQI